MSIKKLSARHCQTTAPGTSFEDLPDDWVCPICGVGKDQFSKVE